jgi:tetratricopeptide (TPR) repeat protein
LISAHASFVETKEFEAALTLLEQFPELFDQVQVVKMRAHTNEQWGLANVREASDQTRHNSKSLAKQGRYHLRAAGRDYERLAQTRFATPEFTKDLWSAAECYYLGQNYTQAARVLEEYLHYEAELRSAAALLRLGQSLLTIEKIDSAVQVLEQCIEMYPRDVSVYQARLECVRAYVQQNRIEEAEQLLLTNLTGDSLTPKSPEWQDSLFALGQLLHDTERYQQAISKLEEAVIRYPNAPQALMARYTIARSFHKAAEVPAEKVREAKTENERQKNRKLRDQNLEGALQNYLLVQRMITLDGRGANTPLKRNLLRNCYKMQGSVLFQLRRYEDARAVYANVSTLYQNDPFVLESFVHIANCWRQLNEPLKARGTIEQAKLVMQRLPRDTDFRLSTNFDRQYWDLLLNEMSKW